MAMRSREGSVARLAVPLVLVLFGVGCASGAGARPAGDSPRQTERPAAVEPPDGGARAPDPAPQPGTSSSDTRAAVSRTLAESSPGPEDPGGSTEQAPRYITGLRLDSVRAVLADHGLSCSEPSPTADGGPWSCWGTSPDRSVDYSVTVDATDQHRVRHVTALITQFGSADRALADAFLGDLASLAYKGARPDSARRWVRDWLVAADATPDQSRLGHAVLSLQGTLESCSLDIAALDAPSD